MKEKIYYTLEEVHEYLDKLDKHRVEKRKESPVRREVFDVFGFDCIHNFCKTSKGWVPSHEDCCPYCVKCIIHFHGSRNDRLKFNENSGLGEKHIVPVTNKEIAIDKKSSLKIKKKDVRVRNLRKYRIQRRIGKIKASTSELRNALKKMKSYGIPILGRGKENLYDDVFQFSGGMVYVKGLKGSTYSVYISENDSVEEHIKDAIDRKNKIHKSSIKYPDSFDVRNANFKIIKR